MNVVEYVACTICAAVVGMIAAFVLIWMFL